MLRLQVEKSYPPACRSTVKGWFVGKEAEMNNVRSVMGFQEETGNHVQKLFLFGIIRPPAKLLDGRKVKNAVCPHFSPCIL